MNEKRNTNTYIKLSSKISLIFDCYKKEYLYNDFDDDISKIKY